MAKVTRSRAFDAFLPDTEPGEELSNARLLPLDCIEPNPHQARMAFSPEKLAELAASIREHGVLGPIQVLALPDGRYQILAGERRYRAAKAVGLTDIPAIIRDELSEEAAAFITATENLQRADLDIEDEARQFAYLLQLTELSQRALADKLGIGYNYLSRRVRLLEYPDLLAAVRAGQLPLNDALRQVSDPRPLPAGDADLCPGDTNSTEDSSLCPGDTNSQADSTLSGAALPATRITGDADARVDAFAIQLVERTDLDQVIIGDVASDLDAAPRSVPRWRYVDEAERALRRIDAGRIPPPERRTWLQRVAELEAILADLKRRLLTLEEGGNPHAV